MDAGTITDVDPVIALAEDFREGTATLYSRQGPRTHREHPSTTTPAVLKRHESGEFWTLAQPVTFKGYLVPFVNGIHVRFTEDVFPTTRGCLAMPENILAGRLTLDPEG